MCVKKLLFLLLLFLFCSLLAFSQGGNSSPQGVALSALLAQSSPVAPSSMTDAQIIAELTANLNKREASIKLQETALASDREALTRDQAVLKSDRALLTNDQEALKTDKAILESRKQLLTETETYWKSYKSDTLKDKLIAAGLGFAGGFVLGGYSGFHLGVTVHY